MKKIIFAVNIVGSITNTLNITTKNTVKMLGKQRSSESGSYKFSVDNNLKNSDTFSFICSKRGNSFSIK